jgi:16S rRNA (guanine966-N2)-methyltransferase
LRFTGGESKGRPILGPKGRDLRPTSDRVREALFDILGSRIRGSAFLDAFAGTGAVGLEALSRGALRAVFLERDRAALRLIVANLTRSPWERQATVLSGEVERSLARLTLRGESFQVMFFDPPYDAPVDPRVLDSAAALLDPEGILALEHRAARPPDMSRVHRFRRGRSYRHGDTALTLLWPLQEGPGG